MELNIEKIEQAVISQALDHILDEDGISDKVDTIVRAKIDKIFTDKCKVMIEEAIQESIKKGFERQYSKVDSFGRPVGEPTTLGCELEKMVNRYWDQKVDSGGKPADGYSAKMTRAEYVMGQMIAADFNSHVKQLVVNASGSFKDLMRDSLYGSVNELLSGIIRVSSHGDNGKQRTGSACIDPKQS